MPEFLEHRPAALEGRLTARSTWSVVVSLARAALFAVVVWSIHHAHQRRTAAREHVPLALAQPTVVKSVFPDAARVVPVEGGREVVLDAADEELGFVVQTSPDSDRIVGFSGPTNLLVAFGPDGRIAGLRVLSSGDTLEHVGQVLRDPLFLRQYDGLTWEEAAAHSDVDAVSGATLTSLAIVEGLRKRLGAAPRSLKFPQPPELAVVRKLFPEAAAVAQEPSQPGLWRVTDGSGVLLGMLLRTTPAADNVVGYQGPTEALIGLTVVVSGDEQAEEMGKGTGEALTPSPTPIGRGEDDDVPPGNTDRLRVSGLAVGQTYDNEPYVGYVREDRYFLKLFNGKSLVELSQLDLKAAGVEGVSGATMTSQAVAQGLVEATRRNLEEVRAIETAAERSRLKLSPRDIGTIAVTLLGLVVGLTPLRGRRWVRGALLVVLVGYLGFVNGDLVSQALLAGWAQHGVPWRTMLGPGVLTAAALAVPLATRHNVYCTHLCPYGAAQQLLRKRLPWQMHLGTHWHRALSLLPGLILVWVVIVATVGLPCSLVDIEPFDAYVPTIAGWATLTIAVVGLVASAFVPMAYCRYGCPTGALLGYLRRNRRSGQVTWRDLFAAALAGLGVALALGS
jgi:NosR/NirI family nitrous oxide reductase transcriptional regulator